MLGFEALIDPKAMDPFHLEHLRLRRRGSTGCVGEAIDDDPSNRFGRNRMVGKACASHTPSENLLFGVIDDVGNAWLPSRLAVEAPQSCTECVRRAGGAEARARRAGSDAVAASDDRKGDQQERGAPQRADPKVGLLASM